MPEQWVVRFFYWLVARGLLNFAPKPEKAEEKPAKRRKKKNCEKLPFTGESQCHVTLF